MTNLIANINYMRGLFPRLIKLVFFRARKIDLEPIESDN